MQNENSFTDKRFLLTWKRNPLTIKGLDLQASRRSVPAGSVHHLVLNSAICASNFCVVRYILLSLRLINVDTSRKWISLKY